MSQIDFAKLPAPDLVEPLDFETILARRKARLLGLVPADQRDNVARTLELESEPMTILLQENAYMELLLRQRINEAAVATLLAKARGADLDNRAADYGVNRLLITPADPDAVPPIDAIWESDDRLRMRAQMALEGLSVAGPRGAYVFHALSASPHVADVKVVSPAGGDVNVYVLDDRGNGVPDATLLATVQAALSAETVRPLNDRPYVIAGTPRSFAAHALIEFEDGGEAISGGLAAAQSRAEQALAQLKRLEGLVSHSALDAAVHVTGVRRVTWLSPTADVVCALNEFPLASSVTVERR
ncbi:baseplate assembly protein [Jeongeupia chitinilytica]|uniref:Baseplate assembly protein n=1 Tax=Jeongeupia chitinilytica TaxID=1041641 RepID=A0ABQ3GXD2_9NEIS|nr:baseplate J/gp47 family protein [Jeongeupia chitinilytica]GHD59853.1 baseplate assembly protein [Jeongeupia chitinilytica]